MSLNKIDGTMLRAVVNMLLLLYATRMAPRLPDGVLQLFDNQYFRLAVFSLILWTARMNPATSILLALAFMVTTNIANKQPLWEFLENVTEQIPEVALENVAEPAPADSEAQPAAVLEVAPEFVPEVATEPVPEAVVASIPQAADSVSSSPASIMQEQPTPVAAEEPIACYPVRKVDMNKVTGFESSELFTF